MKQKRKSRTWPLTAALVAIVGVTAATMAKADDRKAGAAYLLFALRWAADHQDTDNEAAKIDAPSSPAAAESPVRSRDAAEQRTNKPQSVAAKEPTGGSKSGNDLPPDMTRFNGKP